MTFSTLSTLAVALLRFLSACFLFPAGEVTTPSAERGEFFVEGILSDPKSTWLLGTTPTGTTFTLSFLETVSILATETPSMYFSGSSTRNRERCPLSVNERSTRSGIGETTVPTAAVTLLGAKDTVFLLRDLGILLLHIFLSTTVCSCRDAIPAPAQAPFRHVLDVRSIERVGFGADGIDDTTSTSTISSSISLFSALFHRWGDCCLFGDPLPLRLKNLRPWPLHPARGYW